MYLSALNMQSDCFFFSTYHFLTDASLQFADKDQQESRVVTGKTHVRCRCKIRYESFTAASRGSLRDSTAFLLFIRYADSMNIACPAYILMIT